jgi:hypothetical protein
MCYVLCIMHTFSLQTNVVPYHSQYIMRYSTAYVTEQSQHHSTSLH